MARNKKRKRNASRLAVPPPTPAADDAQAPEPPPAVLMDVQSVVIPLGDPNALIKQKIKARFWRLADYLSASLFWVLAYSGIIASDAIVYQIMLLSMGAQLEVVSLNCVVSSILTESKSTEGGKDA
jgi:hypothetical protein